MQSQLPNESFDNQTLEYLTRIKGLKINRKKFINQFLKIVDKDNNSIPLVEKFGQVKLYDGVADFKRLKKPARIVILKARQLGFSTETGGIFTTDTILRPHTKTVIVTHQDDATNNLFEMYKRFIVNLPPELKPEEKLNNGKVILFNNNEGTGLDSSIRCMTASNEGMGASQTITNLHLSELGLWKGNIKVMYSTIMQCVPKSPNSTVIVESTARGFNFFYDICMKARTGVDPITKCGKNGFRFLFCGWWEDKEYTLPYTGFELTEYEKEIKQRYKLTNDQLEWRRWCLESNCGGDLNLFNQEYPGCPEDAFIASGACFFDNYAVSMRLKTIQDEKFRFDFEYKKTELSLLLENIKDVKKRNGLIQVWKEPQERVPYVIGCDTSGEGSDYFVAQVINNMTGEQVAMLRSKFDERTFVEQVFCLGFYYNTALIAIETNFSTYPSAILERMDYPKMYQREATDTYTGKLQKKWGFKTTRGTRQPALDGFRDTVKDNMNLLNDRTTVSEMLTFVKDETGRPAALLGQHDDCVMALAIAHACRGQQEATYLPEEVKEKVVKTPWYLDDGTDTNEEGAYISWNN